MAVKELKPGHMKIRAANDFWNNLRSTLLRRGVYDITLKPKGRFTELDVRVWAAQNGYAIDKLSNGSLRLAVRKAA